MTNYQVTFLKSPLSLDGHQFKRAQQVIIDIDAVNAEAAVEAAKRRFEYLIHLGDWHIGADLIEVSARPIKPEMMEFNGSLWFRCPVTDRELYAGIDVDALTASRIGSLSVSAECPFCHRSHTWLGRSGILGNFSSDSDEPLRRPNS